MTTTPTRGNRIAVTFFAGLVTWWSLAGMQSDWRACEKVFGSGSHCFLWPTFLGAALVMLWVWFHLVRRPNRKAVIGWSTLAALVATLPKIPGSGVSPLPPHCWSFFGHPVPCEPWVTPLLGGIVAVTTALILIAIREEFSARPARISFTIGFVSMVAGLAVLVPSIPVYHAELSDGEACWSIFSLRTRCEPGLAVALASAAAVAVMLVLVGYRRAKLRRSEPLTRAGQ